MHSCFRRAEARHTSAAFFRHAGSRYLAAVALSLAGIVCSHAAIAQAFSVVPRTLAWSGTSDDPSYASEWSNGSIVMPFVSSSVHDQAARRINEALYLELVGMPAPGGSTGKFRLPDGSEHLSDDSLLNSTASLGFTVGRNDARVLSLAINHEGCGAYCEEWTDSVHFSAVTGAAFTSEDIIFPEARRTIVRMVQQQRTREYTALLKQLREQRRTLPATGAPAKAKEAQADLDERIGFNEQCLAGATEASNDAARDGDDSFGYLKLSIPDSDSVAFVAERCSNHGMRALDDVGDVTWRISNDKLRSYLSAYGLAVFFGDDAPAMPPTLAGQILHGRIGSAPITLRLSKERDSSSVTAVYFYDKYRRPIALSGTREGQRLQLSNGKEGADLETFELNSQGNGYSGVWHKQQQQLAVTVGF